MTCLQYWEMAMGSAMILLTAALIALRVCHRRRRRLPPMPPRPADEREMVPPKIREASHALANETMKLGAVTRRIERARDPFGELMRAMRGG